MALRLRNGNKIAGVEQSFEALLRGNPEVTERIGQVILECRRIGNDEELIRRVRKVQWLRFFMDDISRRIRLEFPEISITEQANERHNAFGYAGGKGRVVIGDALLRVLPLSSVRWLAAHEMGHIYNRDSERIARVGAKLAKFERRALSTLVVGATVMMYAGEVKVASMAQAYRESFGQILQHFYSGRLESIAGAAAGAAQMAAAISVMIISGATAYLGIVTLKSVLKYVKNSSRRRMERRADKIAMMITGLNDSVNAINAIKQYVGQEPEEGFVRRLLNGTHPTFDKRVEYLRRAAGLWYGPNLHKLDSGENGCKNLVQLSGLRVRRDLNPRP